MNKDESKNILTPEQRKMVMDARKAGSGISELGDDELENVAGGMAMIIEYDSRFNHHLHFYCGSWDVTDEMFRIYLPASWSGNSLASSNGCPIGGPICPKCEHYQNFISHNNYLGNP